MTRRGRFYRVALGITMLQSAEGCSKIVPGFGGEGVRAAASTSPHSLRVRARLLRGRVAAAERDLLMTYGQQEGTEPERVSLSYPLSADAPVVEGAYPLLVVGTSRVSQGALSDTSLVQFWNHIGTHLDGPAHMLPGHGPLTDYVPGSGLFFRSVALADIPCEPGQLITEDDFRQNGFGKSECQLLLVRTGFSRHRKDALLYSRRNPGFTPSAARYLLRVCPNLRCVGIDTISFAAAENLGPGIEAHRILFGKGPPVLLIEDMNLDYDLAGLLQVIVTPFLIEKLDSCPCSVVAELCNGYRSGVANIGG